MTAQRSTVNPVLEPLVAVHRELYPKADLSLLQRAYEVAEKRHAGQLRRSGDPYITHPLAVANILAELGMDTTTLVAALLHDTVEDTGYTLEALTADFGDEVGHLVDGVTKLDKVALGTAAEARDHPQDDHRDGPRPAGAGDQGRRPAAQHAHHALPAAGEAGPQGPRDAGSHCAAGASAGHGHRQVGARGPVVRDPAPQEVRGDRAAGRRPGAVPRHLPGQGARRDHRELDASKINAVVEGRPKHYWSIYQKMIVKGRDFDEIHDLVGVRILCDEIRDCYAAMGVVHSLWQPMAGRFKDYIAQPRFGVYQSLHTTVVGPEGKPLEVQIRTYDMHQHRRVRHRRALALQGSQGPQRSASARRRRDRRHGLDAATAGLAAGGRRPRRVPGIAALRPGGQEIFVFTPKGDVITLPAGSTPVDFAYAVHTEVGHRCIGARVNGRLVALERKLENGKWSRSSRPRRPTPGRRGTGRRFVASPRAKTKIRQWFAK